MPTCSVVAVWVFSRHTCSALVLTPGQQQTVLLVQPLLDSWCVGARHINIPTVDHIYHTRPMSITRSHPRMPIRPCVDSVEALLIDAFVTKAITIVSLPLVSIKAIIATIRMRYMSVGLCQPRLSRFRPSMINSRLCQSHWVSSWMPSPGHNSP